MAAYVEVKARPVLEEDIRGAPPAKDATKEVASGFVRAQPSLAPQRTSDAVFVLDSKDPAIHGGQPTA
jgi:hypothetical protein